MVSFLLSMTVVHTCFGQAADASPIELIVDDVNPHQEKSARLLSSKGLNTICEETNPKFNSPEFIRNCLCSSGKNIKIEAAYYEEDQNVTLTDEPTMEQRRALWITFEKGPNDEITEVYHFTPIKQWSCPEGFRANPDAELRCNIPTYPLDQWGNYAEGIMWTSTTRKYSVEEIEKKR